MSATWVPGCQKVLDEVFTERVLQEMRYGHVNPLLEDGTGPETRWLLPYTSHSAEQIEATLRGDYEDWETEVGLPTWAHLVREEIAEAFKETDDDRLEQELIQVAALCVSWVEHRRARREAPAAASDGTVSQPGSPNPFRCPTCESPDPRWHPAVSGGGEVTHICPDAFHGACPDPFQGVPREEA